MATIQSLEELTCKAYGHHFEPYLIIFSLLLLIIYLYKSIILFLQNKIILIFDHVGTYQIEFNRYMYCIIQCNLERLGSHTSFLSGANSAQ